MTLSYKDTIQRVGYTIFEDAAYKLQDECLSKIGGSVDE